MREGSRGDHEHAESSDFVADLMAGRAHPARYAAYLRRLRAVYAALETAVHEQRHHVAGRPGARRCPVPSRRPRPGPRPLGAGRCRSGHLGGDRRLPERIERAAHRPHLLVAHHYTRYLGDLSGGRMLARALRRGYPRPGTGPAGLAFLRLPRRPEAGGLQAGPTGRRSTTSRSPRTSARRWSRRSGTRSA
ncbi:biliverdin-producing heme oxygenase [Nocardioides ungokensis]|uniref:biliverdin-producing heme oxygenase n=1 Tax=Nocardioides ungokensis TaxID=1643322 RepID=UPI001C60DA02|nr:biliverdin-producing heme oxygenase [Nocardioides ungokensis]